MKLTGDDFEYLLESALQCVNKVDVVAYNEATRIASFIIARERLVPVVDYQAVDKDKVLASLVVGIGMWYAGGTGQNALNAAATLAFVLGNTLADYEKPSYQTLWKD